jgi:hypothetical protein
MIYREETIELMEPMLPEAQNLMLADLAVALLERAASLKALIQPNLATAIGHLVKQPKLPAIKNGKPALCSKNSLISVY